MAPNGSNTVELNPQITAVSFVSLVKSGKVGNGQLRITYGKLLCGLDSGYTFNSWHFPVKSNFIISIESSGCKLIEQS